MKRTFGQDELRIGSICDLRDTEYALVNGVHRPRVKYLECIVRDVVVSFDGSIKIGVAYRPVPGTRKDAIAQDGFESQVGAWVFTNMLRLR